LHGDEEAVDVAGEFIFDEVSEPDLQIPREGPIALEFLSSDTD
jgi:hypothetical protein